MEFTPDKQVGPLSDETVGDNSEQGQKEKPAEISQETVLVVAMSRLEISEDLPTKTGPPEMEVNSESVAVVNGTATFEVENVPHEQSPSVALGEQSDLKLEIDRLQQEVARLEALNLQKDAEILALEKENRQVETDCSNMCSSVAASFSFKQQESENKLKHVRNHFKQLATNFEKVNNLLESSAEAHSELTDSCREITDKCNRYKAYCMFISESLSKVAKNDENLEGKIESFEGLTKEALQLVSETNAFIGKSMDDVAKT